MSDIRCFMLQETERVSRGLRVYEHNEIREGTCGHWHDVGIWVDELLVPQRTIVTPEIRRPQDFPPGDPRWPARCACGFEFTEKAERYVRDRRIFHRFDVPPGEPEWFGHIADAQPGAMWWNWWDNMPDSAYHIERGGGVHLNIKLPDGIVWDIDRAASKGGKGWKRTGNPPRVTSHACDGHGGSILTPTYHGVLIDGVLKPTG